MHPHDAKDVGVDELAVLKNLAADPKVVAIGETGLDYYYSHSPHDVQRRVFGQFIHMARQTQLPIVVHERDAAQDAAELLRGEGAGELRGVIHCFTGNYEAACAYLDLGFYLSFTGIITFKNADAAARSCPESSAGAHIRRNRFALSHPVPHRGKRNEPAYVRFVAETIAKVKGLAVDEVAQVTTANVKQLFRI